MTASTEGWAWIEPPAVTEEANPADAESSRESSREATARAFARCFRTTDGQHVLSHLRRVTLDRTLGPATSDAALRYLEGQRALVANVLALVERGNQEP